MTRQESHIVVGGRPLNVVRLQVRRQQREKEQWIMLAMFVFFALGYFLGRL